MAVVENDFIVVGVDGSDLSIGALRWADEHAHRIGADVHAVVAFDIPWHIYVTPTATDDFYMERAQAVLKESLAVAFPRGSQVPVHEKVVQSRPSIVLTAAAKGARLLVVGATGHGAIPNMLIGSVATACAHHAPCPVLIWRPTED
jgi:nucleotide-binding universal stress UspA family protein